MSDTPRTNDECRRRAQLRVSAWNVSADFARELERELAAVKADLAQRTAERDEAWLTNATLRADLARANAERDALAAEVAALKAHDPLAEMWRELAEYQEQADANGHGDTWRAMCHKRTEEAASAAYLARQWSSHVAAAAYGAWWAAQRDAAVRRISNDAVKWAADAVAAIRRAKEGQR